MHVVVIADALPSPPPLRPCACSYEEDLGAALAALADQGAKFDKASALIGAWLSNACLLGGQL